MANRLAAGLLPWFRKNRRDLPWRRTRDPYAILVSEFMLQQTRVAAVVDRFGAFLRRFPMVRALADADGDDVLALWSGLGYYRRARSLHAAAKTIRDRHGGAVPGDAAALRELPGIGAYTAAAVASIAFGRREAVVDGNVARVLSRLFRLRGDPRKGAPARRLRDLAQELVPRDGTAGEWNEALMELGATVCLPRSPRCAECPLAGDCGALRERRAEAYPETESPARSIRESVVCVAIARAGRWLLTRNGPGERPEGMYGFIALRELPPEAPLRRVAAAVRRELGLALADIRELGTFRHQIMNRSITVRALAARAERGSRKDREGPQRTQRCRWRWVRLADLGRLPVSAAAMRVARLLMRSGSPDHAP